MTSERKQLILDTIDDLVANFLYYDRKEDEDLPLHEIEDAVKNGEITIEEMTNRFSERLSQSLGLPDKT
jgi:hypothetical protein